MARKSTGKRLRFEVFKRDHFTCQYCGAQPPSVVLVADHIDPVALGGETSIENLITSCEPCNQGKSDKPLGLRAIRPDADLLYLQTQQEIVELRRYQDARAEREDLIDEIIDSLALDWRRASGLHWNPDDGIFRQLLEKFSPEIAESAVKDVAQKVGGRYLSTSESAWRPYLFRVAYTMAREEDEYDQTAG